MPQRGPRLALFLATATRITSTFNMQSNQQTRRDSVQRFLFAVIVGNASLCSGIWLYRSAGTADSESPSVQIATIGGCAALAAMGLFFLFFALKQAKAWRDEGSLPRIMLVMMAGTSLLAFSLFFFTTQATVLATEQKELESRVAEHDALIKHEIASAQNLSDDFEWSAEHDGIIKRAPDNPGGTPSPAPDGQQVRKKYEYRKNLFLAMNPILEDHEIRRERIVKKVDERLVFVFREQIVVVFGSGLCGLIGVLLVTLSLRMWCSSQFHHDTPPVS